LQLHALVESFISPNPTPDQLALAKAAGALTALNSSSQSLLFILPKSPGALSAAERAKIDSDLIQIRKSQAVVENLHRPMKADDGFFSYLPTPAAGDDDAVAAHVAAATAAHAAAHTAVTEAATKAASKKAAKPPPLPKLNIDENAISIRCTYP